ncbi:MAG: hypothetical protein D6704_03075 [Nitrospirae bacterium]|nr:MAG: hypothetical protein D6704_03075 [Nitrospirota bacterium]
MVSIIWPTVTHCLFAALVFGGPDTSKHEYQPVTVESNPCSAFVAYVSHSAVVLERGHHRVEIPLPSDAKWHRLQYYWGTDAAFVEDQLVPVRMGPIGSY